MALSTSISLRRAAGHIWYQRIVFQGVVSLPKRGIEAYTAQFANGRPENGAYCEPNGVASAPSIDRKEQINLSVGILCSTADDHTNAALYGGNKFMKSGERG